MPRRRISFTKQDSASTICLAARNEMARPETSSRNRGQGHALSRAMDMPPKIERRRLTHAARQRASRFIAASAKLKQDYAGKSERSEPYDKRFCYQSLTKLQNDRTGIWRSSRVLIRSASG